MLGALTGGFVSGLAGFGTGLVAMGIFLHVLSPATAVTLVIICSVISQIQTIPSIWHAFKPARVLPFVIPGLIGVPIGTSLLAVMDPNVFRTGMGILLLGFSTFSLLCGPGLNIVWGGRRADGIIGLAGGILGGLTGLSGPLPTLWAAVRGWGKDERRSLFQAYNLTILFTALLAHTLSGRLTAEVGWSTLAALPGTIGGSWLGASVYRRLSDHQFHNAILILLALSGLILLVSA